MRCTMKVIKLRNDAKDLLAFIKFPYTLYKNNAHYCADIKQFELQQLLDPNGIHVRDYFSYFMVYDNGKAVGRIACGISFVLNQKTKQNHGYICLFECINSTQASRLLLDAAVTELKDNNVQEIYTRQCAEFNQFGKGILKETFDTKVIEMYPYNFEYYIDLLQDYGFKPHRNHDTFWMDFKNYPKEKFATLIEKAQRRFAYRVEGERLRPNNVKIMAEKLSSVIHQAYHTDWNVSQPSIMEIENQLQYILRFANYNQLVFAYADQRVIGAYVVHDNYRQRINRCKGSSILYFFSRLFAAGPSTSLIANMIFVVPDFQLKAVDLAMAHHSIETAKKHGFTDLELFTTPSTNKQYAHAFVNIGGEKIAEYTQLKYTL